MSCKKSSSKSNKVSQADVWKTPFVVFQAGPEEYYNMSQEAHKGILQESVLSRMFFHPKNVNIIQMRIIKDVFDKTKGKYLIEKQSEDDIMVVMRSMFLQHARHLEYDLDKQVDELNFYVIDDVAPGIISEIWAQEGYLKKVFEPREIMEHPINLSSSGTRTLPSVTTLFK